MSLFGVNLTANHISSATESSANPLVTLTPTQFEGAVSQIAAQYVWAGEFVHVGQDHAPPLNRHPLFIFQLATLTGPTDLHLDSARALLRTS